jgi:hypothetical protein
MPFACLWLIYLKYVAVNYFGVFEVKVDESYVVGFFSSLLPCVAWICKVEILMLPQMYVKKPRFILDFF